MGSIMLDELNRNSLNELKENEEFKTTGMGNDPLEEYYEQRTLGSTRAY